MKSLILSRLWMLIGIIILTTGQAWAQTTGSTSGSTTTQKVFSSIKELRDGANGKSLSEWIRCQGVWREFYRTKADRQSCNSTVLRGS